MTATPIASFDGFGLGLRTPHYQDFLTSTAPVDFVEVISENFMIDGGRPRHILDQIRERHPVALHGVSMSIGSADGLDRAYLARLKTLVDHVDPLFVSDHLCWTRIAGFNAHDLLPLPYTEEALDLVCANILQAQDVLERPMLIENPSTYLQFTADSMTEWQFLNAMCARTGCALLLDVNNIYVSAINHGFDPMTYLDGVPADRVRQIHLAGHSQGRDCLIDTHDQPVPPPVWALYAEACRRIGPVATMIERDDDIPPLADLLAELDMARAIATMDRRRAA
ncbi:hypothetical protein sphantq_04087 [Sphingobium sp. AntQ-1]|uniref:MNIO family bufferin maturase n=1 Tax=Sphingobium sp. AntQ-1 TaxID=2930091 RepID=UPI00234FA2B0|nr:DUF692 domain-containing protein [Sphingobium sp. AntQ-1]WCP15611.1 hypothetical protein sphantq_04087 [Sphingobium sp. AntQ-1]